MPRRRSRHSPIESFVNRVIVWLVVVVGILAVVSLVFQSAPWLGLVLFVVLPVAIVSGIAWFRVRARDAAKREALEDARQRIETARHIGALLTGSGPDFELAVADVLGAYGYDLERIGGSGDRGVDLIGTDANGGKVVVQCKRYGPDNKVGSPAVQSFMGTVVHQDAIRGIFVTTSTYTRQARELVSSSRVVVSLIDGMQFTQMATAVAEHATGNPTFIHQTQSVPLVVKPNKHANWPVPPSQGTQPIHRP